MLPSELWITKRNDKKYTKSKPTVKHHHKTKGSNIKYYVLYRRYWDKYNRCIPAQPFIVANLFKSVFSLIICWQNLEQQHIRKFVHLMLTRSLPMWITQACSHCPRIQDPLFGHSWSYGILLSLGAPMDPVHSSMLRKPVLPPALAVLLLS